VEPGSRKVRLTVEAEEAAPGRVLTRSREVAVDELETAAEEAAEELLEDGLDVTSGVWLRVAAEDEKTGRSVQLLHDPYAVHEASALVTDAALMGDDLAGWLHEPGQTWTARLQVEGLGAAQATAGGSRELMLSLRAGALRMWDAAPELPGRLVEARVELESATGDVYEAEFAAAEREGLRDGVRYALGRASTEAFWASGSGSGRRRRRGAPRRWRRSRASPVPRRGPTRSGTRSWTGPRNTRRSSTGARAPSRGASWSAAGTSSWPRAATARSSTGATPACSTS
jgi:hypothetical protein